VFGTFSFYLLFWIRRCLSLVGCVRSCPSPLQVHFDDFKRVTSLMGIEDEAVAKSMFEALDVDKSGSVDIREFSVLVASHGGGNNRLKILFNLVDLDNDGKVSREEVAKTLSSLINSVNKISLGDLKDRMTAGTKLTYEEAQQTLLDAAIKEIFPGQTQAIDLPRFKTWVESSSPSSKAFVALFDSLSGAMMDKKFLTETRYTAYAFLLARFTKTAKVAVRYLAFTSDVGEAFRPVVPVALVNLTYAVAIGYCVLDVVYVGYVESKKKNGQVARTVAERTVFQALASVLLPFAIIHTQVHVFHTLLHARGGNLAKFGPTLAGLALIPLLPTVCDEPVEHAVEAAFDAAWPLFT